MQKIYYNRLRFSRFPHGSKMKIHVKGCLEDGRSDVSLAHSNVQFIYLIRIRLSHYNDCGRSQAKKTWFVYAGYQFAYNNKPIFYRQDLMLFFTFQRRLRRIQLPIIGPVICSMCILTEQCILAFNSTMKASLII